MVKEEIKPFSFCNFLQFRNLINGSGLGLSSYLFILVTGLIINKTHLKS